MSVADPAASSATSPRPGTLERWAFDYIVSARIESKLAPPPRPLVCEESPLARPWVRPGRPPEWKLLDKTPRSLKTSDLCLPRRRAQQIHTFIHHELQAAELMCWALLAFPDAPNAFRMGLLSICQDEIRHMHLYQEHLQRLGYEIGAFPVRDWFWERVPSSATPAQFVAVMGMGLEGGNLDHTARFARRFREVGDEQAARIEEIVGEEEIPHVRFAVHWFRELCGNASFESWASHLPKPLSPRLMHGFPLDVDSRRKAGQSDQFIEQLAQW